MKKIYSKVEEGKLLHIINRKNEITQTRNNICPDNEIIQVSCFELPKDKTFKAHKHIKFDKSVTTTQESWVIIRGSVKAILYDLDDTIISEEILEEGDCSITFYGGHNYYCLEDNTLVYEFKTGPYFGIENDKVFI